MCFRCEFALCAQGCLTTEVQLLLCVHVCLTPLTYTGPFTGLNQCPLYQQAAAHCTLAPGRSQAQVQVANSVDDVNAWVKDVTQGLIPNLLSPGTPFDVVLTNALYFKGKWLYRFKETDTEPRTFTTAKGEKKQVG